MQSKAPGNSQGVGPCLRWRIRAVVAGAVVALGAACNDTADMPMDPDDMPMEPDDMPMEPDEDMPMTDEGMPLDD